MSFFERFDKLQLLKLLLQQIHLIFLTHFLQVFFSNE